VPLGFIAACVAAGCMAALGLIGPEYLHIDSSGWYLVGAIPMMFWIATIAFLPATIAIILAECLGWRSALYYLLVGGLIGATAIHLTTQSGALDFADRPNVTLLAAGFVGGFVYWLIAGRLAGTGFARAMSGKAETGFPSDTAKSNEGSSGSASGQA
jgi:hypothetical protein